MANQNVIVIGGGAAGFFGAIAIAEANPACRVTLLEAAQQVLAKVRISGGGRCNVTHSCFDPAELIGNYPRGSKALRGAFTRFQPGDTVGWFSDRGIPLKTEADGRMFPTTDDSATIVDGLQLAAADAGVRVKTGAAVTAVRHTNGPQHPDHNQPDQNPGRGAQPCALPCTQPQFEVQLKNGEVMTCDRLLLATGSSPQGHRIAQSLGSKIEPTAPSLFTFNIPEKKLTALAGVSVQEAQLKLTVPGPDPTDKKAQTKLQQSGPLLITHWGLSGPAVLKLSAWGARALKTSRYQAKLWVNWLPSQSLEAIQQQLNQAKQAAPRKQISNHRPFLFPQRLWEYWVRRAGIDPETRWTELSKKALIRLSQELHQAEYQVQGKGVFKDEFVTCGGVSLKTVNFKTMESKACPGLHFAGEILDIDGVTGGFNFQSAWTTSWLAGQAIAESLQP